MRTAILILIISISSYGLFLQGASSQSENKDAKIERNEKIVSIRAAGRVNFADGKDLTARANGANQNAPLKLAAVADFDSDGTADLITADTGGNLKLYRGNADSIFPHSAQANENRSRGAFNEEAFFGAASVGHLSLAPDFLAAGDFNADGRADILAAAKNDNVLHLLAGDGAGNFSPDFQIQIDGTITALAAGEIGRSDGQTDLAIAVTGKNGAQLLIFEHPEGAFKYQPEVIKLSTPATEIAVGNLDEDFYADIIVGSGNKLTLVHGRGQAYPWDLLEEYDLKRPDAIVETRQLPFEIAALAVGKFTERRGDSLAILTTGGSLHTLDSPALEKRQNPKSKIRILKSAGLFVPAGVEADEFAVLENDFRNDAGKSDLAPARRDEMEKFLRERSEKAAAELKRLSSEDKAKLTAEALRQAAEKRERAKAGFLETISPRPFAPLAEWNLQILISDARLASAAIAPNSQKLTVVRVSDSGKDELALLDPSAKQIHIISPLSLVLCPSQEENKGQRTKDKGLIELISFESETSPQAILPMRLNADALSDLVVLREHSSVPSVVLTAPEQTFVVTNTNNEGEGSLRQAIVSANQTTGADMITFNIGSGVQTISLTTVLPDIESPVTIDGTTQPGFSGKPLIEIKGASLTDGRDGLRVHAPNVVIRGLAINEFKAEIDPEIGNLRGGNGIAIFNFAGETFVRNAIIEGNFLGTDPAGELDKGNDATGINIFDADDNRIGGTTSAARNVLSGSGNGNQGDRPRRGVGLSVTAGNNNQIKGNYIGTDASGVFKIANSYGIFFTGIGNQFGGDEAGAGNVVSGNGEPFELFPGVYRCIGVGITEETLVNPNTMELLTMNNNYKGNRIGTTFNGAAALGNCTTGLVTNPIHTPVIGSITESGRNVISGNKYDGVYCSWAVQGENFAEANLAVGGDEFPPGFCNISGNNVGTDITGTQAIPNTIQNGVNSFVRFNGAVSVFNTETFSNIGAPGGTSPAACTGFCNLISGNALSAEEGYAAIDRASALGTVGIFNNHVGTDRTGTSTLPNGGGFTSFISGGDTLIGGVGADSNNLPISLGNLISGNLDHAIFAEGFLDTFPTYKIEGNLIGTNKSGTTAVPNGTYIERAAIYAATDAIISIGGSGALSRNIIAGNAGSGIQIFGETPTAPVAPRIVNNYIGVNIQKQPLGNGRDGIEINGSGIPIGGNSVEEANIIAHNARNGVFIEENSPDAYVGNRIRFNSIYNNGALGIDLAAGGLGVTPNDCLDADEGANRLQNFPVLTAPVFNQNGTVTVGGGFQSTPSSRFTLDFYASQTADPTKYGEGETFIGSQTVQTDNSGVTTFSFTSTVQVPAGRKITATAIDVDGNTSEFSCAAGECMGGTGGLTEAEILELMPPTCLVPIIVNINTDEEDANPGEGICDVDVNTSGSQCSLRAAIQTANARSGFDLINFDIPGAGVQTISPARALPDITEKVNIDATTQPGYQTNAPVVEINGAGAGEANGMTVRANEVSISGFIINRFTGVADQTGNGIYAESVRNLTIQSCFIGTDAAGMAAAPNRHNGILLRSVFNSRIGGDIADYGNLISGNGSGGENEPGIGIYIFPLSGGLVGNNRIVGNRIGVDKTGAAPLSNKNFGVLVGNSDGNAIGDETDAPGVAPGNVISGNNSTNGGGVAITNSKENKVQGNLIGTNAAGAAGFGNKAGVTLLQSPNNLIGGSTPAARNVISGNLNGVLIVGELSKENHISGNYIGTNPNGSAHVPVQGAPGVTRQALGVGIEGAGKNLIGGASEGERNVIAANELFQVRVVFTESEDNQISGNYIGLFADGSTAPSYPQMEFGVFTAGARRTIVGGSSAGERNVISGNSFGVFISNPENSADGQHKILGNYIGTNAQGSAALANTLGGISVVKSSNNQIGGSGANERNVISGNRGLCGIFLANDEPPESPFNSGGFDVFAKSRPESRRNISSPFEAIETIRKIGAAEFKNRPANPAQNAAAETKNNRIINNYIGLSASGQTAIANTPCGVILTLGASENLVGGTTPQERNVISGNHDGVFIGNLQQNAATPSANRVQGNIIGLKPDAAQKLPNTESGVAILFGAGNIIGGETAEAGNIISGNGEDGISIDATSNTVRFNVIGTNASGALGLGNGRDGIRLENVQEKDNLIADNTIAGNGGNGIYVKPASGSPVSQPAQIQNRSAVGSLQFLRNAIGVKNTTGSTLKIPNAQNGIHLENFSNAVVGSSAETQKNIIAGNTGAGVRISGANSINNSIKNSIIGTDASDALGLGNGAEGILITDQSSQNTIGGTEANSGNTIINNGGAGVRLSETSGNRNLIDPNRIFGNGGLGIDLGAPGHTPNDAADADAGANNLQNYPAIVSRQIINNELIVGFKVDSAPAHSAYGANGIYVEFFKADSSGEGEMFLGSGYYTIADYNNGSPGIKTINLGNIAALGITPSDRITATASDADNNTSEFAPPFNSVPTAASVSVGGRVTTADGRAIRNAVMTLAQPDGTTKTVLSGAFGNYRFADVAVGQTVILSIKAKGYVFEAPVQVLSVTENTENLNFTASP